MNKISLFTGAGGLDLGLEAVDIHTRFASDIDPFSCRTLSTHSRSPQPGKFPFFAHASIQQADIRSLDPKDAVDASGLHLDDIHLLVGGPPCQSFSVFGRRGGLEDPRGQLVWQYARFLKYINPVAFIFENVPGLLTIEQGQVFQNFLDTVHDIGYSVDAFVLEAADFGVPQFRKRVFVIGNRLGIHLPPINPTHFDPNSLSGHMGQDYVWRTVRDAFRDLGPLGTLPNHTGRQHSDRIIQRYNSLTHGERDHRTRINKLHPDRPSYTIIVGSDKGGGKGHVHPYEPREVTPRESARIQSFPDWWAFSGTSRHPIRQVGNAVPPLLASAVGNHIREHIFGLSKVSFEEYMHRLGQRHLFKDSSYRLDYLNHYAVGIPSMAVRESSTQKMRSEASVHATAISLS